MHEEALLRDLRRKVDELARQQPGSRIVRAKVLLGALSHLDEPRLRDLWARAMAEGPAAGARLEVELLASTDDPRASSVVLRSVTFEGAGPPAGSSAAGARPSPSSPPRP
jgi:Zn finger protein HypA/HybF involved in hydrogenase expression